MRILPYFGALVFVIGLTLAMTHHEMWRDEIQAWLLSRAASSPWDVMRVIKYDGHPGFWHTLIWPLARFWNNPAGMQICHAVVATTSVFLLFRFAPFHWLIRVLIACGYFFAFEWAVIARNYAVSVMLVFTICILYKERWRFFPWIGGLVFLLCHTNIGSIIFSIVFFFLLMIDYAVAYAGRFRGADRYFKRCIIGFIIIVMGISTGIIQIRPPEDGNFAAGWRFDWKYEHFINVNRSVINAFFPVPVEKISSWNSNRFITSKKEEASWNKIHRNSFLKTSGLILLCASLLFYKRPWMAIQFLLTAVALVIFFYCKYSGSIRHHGLIYLFFLASFWMSYYYDPWRLPWRIPETILAFTDRHRAMFLIPLLCIHIWAAYIALKNDWLHPFSMAKETAKWLKTEYPDRAHRDSFIYVGRSGPMASSLCGYLNGLPFFYIHQRDFGTYMRWRKVPPDEKKMNFNQLVEDVMEREQRDAILVLGSALTEKEIPENCKFLKSFTGAIIGDEQYHLYLWEYKKKEQAQ